MVRTALGKSVVCQDQHADCMGDRALPAHRRGIPLSEAKLHRFVRFAMKPPDPFNGRAACLVDIARREVSQALDQCWIIERPDKLVPDHGRDQLVTRRIGFGL